MNKDFSFGQIGEGLDGALFWEVQRKLAISKDGGLTWAKIDHPCPFPENLLDNKYIKDCKHYFTGSHIIVAEPHRAGPDFYVSSDSGKTWEKISGPTCEVGAEPPFCASTYDWFGMFVSKKNNLLR